MPNPLWRKAVWTTARTDSAILALAFTAAVSALVAAGLSVIRRWQGAEGRERQQLKWLAYVAGITIAAGFGTVRPEEVRETRRRQLENERSRVLAQIKILETSRTRLEAAITTADAEVDRLRRRLEAREMQEQATPTATEASKVQ